MVRLGFSEAYYDNFTGAQQSMELLINNISSTTSILITPKYGKCMEKISNDRVKKEVISYPDCLDKFSRELLNTGYLQKFQIGSNLTYYYLNVVKKFHELDIEILYCNNLRSLLLFGPPAKFLGIPIIWYVRIDTPIEPLDKIGLQLADEIVTISEGVRQRFDERYLKRHNNSIRTIYTGVDLDRFDPEKLYDNYPQIEPNSLTIVEVASINPRKGQDKIIKSLGEIKGEIPDFQMIFVGDVSKNHQNYKKECEEQIRELGLENETMFLGWCDDIPTLLSQADIFVLPSSNEGLPRSILEALAMKVPTISTPAGGTPEIVQDETTGLIVPINNVHELSKAINKLALDAELRDQYGSNGRLLIENSFSEKNYINNFENLISEIKTSI